jgi:HK97 family phage portal protein
MATRLITRLEVFRKSNITKSTIDSVFLRNKLGAEIGGDDVMREPYKKSDLVYICISTTAKAISQVPIIAVEQIGNNGRTRVLPSNNPWQAIWEHPNFMTDRYSFTESIISYLMLEGLCYILPFPPGLNPPDALWVIRKKFVRPIKDSKTGGLLGYYYNPKGMFGDTTGANIPEGSIPIDIGEMCRIFFFNPYDPLDGMAPVEAGKMNIVVDYKSAFYTSVFFDEGAQPGGILSTQQKLGDKQFTRTKEQFQSEHKGYKKAHRVAVLEQGLEYTQTGLTQKDMEFRELRKLSAERIYQTFGMKKAIISVMEDVNYATAREERKEWWEGTNLPMMNMVTSALNFTLFPSDSTIKVKYDITTIAALKDALKDKVDTGYRLWQMGFTADEINNRLDMGFGTEPWRKVWYQPINLMPVDSTLVPQIQEGNPPKFIPGDSIRLIGDGKDLRNETIWNSFIRQTSPLEEIFSKKISRVFFEMRKRILELLYKDTKTPKDVDEDNFIEDSQNLSRFSDPLYKDAMTLGVGMIIEEIGFGISFDLMDPQAIAYLSGKSLKIKGIAQTVKNQIQVELTEAYEKGESIDQIADRIRSVFDIAKNRAKTIARTEIIGASNEGRGWAINHSGFREKEWFTAMDEKVRPEHQAMHGKKIKIGDAWVFPDGTSVRHPGDYGGPPHQIINCRCIEVVVPGSHYLLGRE